MINCDMGFFYLSFLKRCWKLPDYIELNFATGRHQCMIQLSTTPVTVCHGSGHSADEAHTLAARNALKYLKAMTKRSWPEEPSELCSLIRAGNTVRRHCAWNSGVVLYVSSHVWEEFLRKQWFTRVRIMEDWNCFWSNFNLEGRELSNDEMV